MATFIYWCVALVILAAVCIVLMGLVYLLALDLGPWWRHQKPEPQRYGEGRMI